MKKNKWKAFLNKSFLCLPVVLFAGPTVVACEDSTSSQSISQSIKSDQYALSIVKHNLKNCKVSYLKQKDLEDVEINNYVDLHEAQKKLFIEMDFFINSDIKVKIRKEKGDSIIYYYIQTKTVGDKFSNEITTFKEPPKPVRELMEDINQTNATTFTEKVFNNVISNNIKWNSAASKLGLIFQKSLYENADILGIKTNIIKPLGNKSIIFQIFFRGERYFFPAKIFHFASGESNLPKVVQLISDQIDNFTKANLTIAKIKGLEFEKVEWTKALKILKIEIEQSTINLAKAFGIKAFITKSKDTQLAKFEIVYEKKSYILSREISSLIDVDYPAPVDAIVETLRKMNKTTLTKKEFELLEFLGATSIDKITSLIPGADVSNILEYLEIYKSSLNISFTKKLGSDEIKYSIGFKDEDFTVLITINDFKKVIDKSPQEVQDVKAILDKYTSSNLEEIDFAYQEQISPSLVDGVDDNLEKNLKVQIDLSEIASVSPKEIKIYFVKKRGPKIIKYIIDFEGNQYSHQVLFTSFKPDSSGSSGGIADIVKSYLNKFTDSTLTREQFEDYELSNVNWLDALDRLKVKIDSKTRELLESVKNSATATVTKLKGETIATYTLKIGGDTFVLRSFFYNFAPKTDYPPEVGEIINILQKYNWTELSKYDFEFEKITSPVDVETAFQQLKIHLSKEDSKKLKEGSVSVSVAKKPQAFSYIDFSLEFQGKTYSYRVDVSKFDTVVKILPKKVLDINFELEKYDESSIAKTKFSNLVLEHIPLSDTQKKLGCSFTDETKNILNNADNITISKSSGSVEIIYEIEYDNTVYENKVKFIKFLPQYIDLVNSVLQLYNFTSLSKVNFLSLEINDFSNLNSTFNTLGINIPSDAHEFIDSNLTGISKQKGSDTVTYYLTLDGVIYMQKVKVIKFQ